MKSIKRGIAVLLAALLLIPNTPVRAGGSEPVEDLVPDLSLIHI